MQSVELSVKRVELLMKLENKKFLIVILRFHGDVLLTKPLIDDIKTNYPNALIDLLVFKGTASLLEGDEFINEIIEIETSESLNLWQKISSEFSLIRRLKRSKYDFGFFLTTQWRLALMSISMTGVKTAAVSDKKRESFLWVSSFTKIFPEAGNNHIVTRNLNALNVFDIKISENPSLDLPINRKTEIKAAEILKSKELSTKFCVVHPISRREVKLWKKENFIKLIDALESKGIKVLLSSGPDSSEVNYVNYLEDNANSRPINIGGQTSLIELAAIIKKADFFIGLDSVASHISAAVDTPSITLFGPTSAVNWRPWSRKSKVICRDGSEAFCEDHGHKEGKFKKCLCYISPQRVIEELDVLYFNQYK